MKFVCHHAISPYENIVLEMNKKESNVRTAPNGKRIRLQNGWPDFYRENKLCKDNTLVFSVVRRRSDTHKMKLSVRIKPPG